MTRILHGALAASIVVLLAGAASTAQAAPFRPGDSPAVVTTDNETPVLYGDDEGGNATGDDPAIWVGEGADGDDASLVIVTAKEGGLRVYDLDSNELQSLPATAAPRADGVAGRYNNVDIAYGVEFGGRPVDVAVVSDRYNDQLRFFTIDPAGAAAETPLVEVTAAEQPFLFSPDRETVDEDHTAYGLAIWQTAEADYAVVTQEGATTLATARLVDVGGALGYTDISTTDMPTSFPLPDGSTWIPCDEPGIEPHLEGLAVDQRTGVLYAAQEDVGVWRIALPFGSAQPKLIDRVRDFGIHDVYDPETEECAPVDASDEGFGGTALEADAEGVDLYYGPGATGYLIVSSQGDDTFAVYERQGRNALVGTFRVDGIDGADEINGSDGLAVTNRPVGDFRQGLLVTHDEPETGAGVDADRDPTNFSYIGWEGIADALGLKVDTSAGNDPRFR
jgi:3-phytase